MKRPETIDRRAVTRYPLSFECSYKTERVLNNSSRVIEMSSRSVRLTTTDAALRRGEFIVVSVAWPGRCDGVVPLTLLIRGVVLRATARDAVVKIDRHDFWSPDCDGACRRCARGGAFPNASPA